MDDILDGLASDHDAVSNVFFRAVGDGPDLHCIFLEHDGGETLKKKKQTLPPALLFNKPNTTYILSDENFHNSFVWVSNCHFGHTIWTHCTLLVSDIHFSWNKSNKQKESRHSCVWSEIKGSAQSLSACVSW